MEQDPRWQNAACRDISPATADEVFFPSTPGKKPTTANNNFCSSCPILGFCLEAAIANGLQGFWAGTSEPQRKAMSQHQATVRQMVDLDDYLPVIPTKRVGLRNIVKSSDNRSWMDEAGPDDMIVSLMDVGLLTLDELDKVS